MNDAVVQTISGEGRTPMKDRINTRDFLDALGSCRDQNVIARTLGDIALLRSKNGTIAEIKKEQFSQIDFFERQNQVVGLDDDKKLLSGKPVSVETSSLDRVDVMKETDILVNDDTNRNTSFILVEDPNTGIVRIQSNRDQKGLKYLILEGEPALDQVRALTEWFLKAHLEGDINTEAEVEAINARVVELTNNLQGKTAQEKTSGQASDLKDNVSAPAGESGVAVAEAKQGSRYIVLRNNVGFSTLE